MINTLTATRAPSLDAVERELDAFLAIEADRWRRVDERLAEPVGVLRDFVQSGGKRLRPAFCLWGAAGAGSDPDDPGAVRVAAALELLHAFALIHDDVMDGATTRRNRPAVHRHLEHDHARRGWTGEARRCAEGLAVLIGDLAFAYADHLARDLTGAARAIWDELRIELTMGQWLDVTGAAGGDADLDTAARIAVYKSGRYTVERPLHLGAAVGGAFDTLGPHFSAFGLPLGEAFQLRDDLLGVYGDPDATGKPVGDDLREGKPTVLVALAKELATGEDRRTLRLVGRTDLGADEVEALRTAIERCGAREAVEERIADRLAGARRALDRAPVPADVRDGLAALAVSCTERVA